MEDQLPTSCLYRDARHANLDGYELPPPIDCTLPHVHPEMDQMHFPHRIFKVYDQFYKVWSPNSKQWPFYPGPLPPASDTIPPLHQRRFDGHLGPADPTRNPQYYDPTQPWLPFIKRPPTPDPFGFDLADVAFEDVDSVWIPESPDSPWGKLAHQFVNNLVSALNRASEAINHTKHTASWLPGVIRGAYIHLDTPEERERLGKIKWFDEAKDCVIRLQRILLKKRAWLYMSRIYDYHEIDFNVGPAAAAMVYVSHILSQIHALRKQRIPPANDDLVGLWFNGHHLPELDLLWFLVKARVPCFVIQRIGGRPTPTSFITGTAAEMIHNRDKSEQNARRSGAQTL
jgi:hypothetical protein